MAFKVYEKAGEGDYYFDLKESSNGGIILFLRKKNGTEVYNGTVLAILTDGRLYRYGSLNKNLGLKLDDFGKIKQAGEEE